MDRVSLLSLLVGTVLPLLVALVTKASWSETPKALLLAVLSAATGVGAELLHPASGQSAQSVIANAVTAFATGCAVAAGAWRPTGLLATLENTLVKDVNPVLGADGALDAGAARSSGGAAGSTAPPRS
jgi:hypothetical protein